VIEREMSVPPQVQAFKNSVCLFADVSGFTTLSESLCNLGPEGIEELSSQLNKFVGQIVKLTARAGGDVLKFAGDAMIAMWTTVDHAGKQITEKDPKTGRDAPLELTTILQRAIQCALDMQLRLSNYKFKYHRRDEDGRELSETVLF